MADGVLTTLNNDFDRWEKDISYTRAEIKRIDDKRRRENELWDKDIRTLEKKIEVSEQRKRDVRRQMERRQEELDRIREREERENKDGQTKKTGWL